MTAYMMTAEQHAQIVDALKNAEMALCEVSPCMWKECHQNQVEQLKYSTPKVDEALAMLKAMKPSNPSAWLACDKEGNVGCSTKENHALRCCEAGTKAEPLYALGDTA